MPCNACQTSLEMISLIPSWLCRLWQSLTYVCSQRLLSCSSPVGSMMQLVMSACCVVNTRCIIAAHRCLPAAPYTVSFELPSLCCCSVALQHITIGVQSPSHVIVAMPILWRPTVLRYLYLMHKMRCDTINHTLHSPLHWINCIVVDTQASTQVVVSAVSRMDDPHAVFGSRSTQELQLAPAAVLPAALQLPDPLYDFDTGSWHHEDIIDHDGGPPDSQMFG